MVLDHTNRFELVQFVLVGSKLLYKNIPEKFILSVTKRIWKKNIGTKL